MGKLLFGKTNQRAKAIVEVEVICPSCEETRIVKTQQRHIKNVRNRLCRSCAQKQGKSVYKIRESLSTQTRECLFCDTVFVPRSGNHRCCSEECAILNWRNKREFGGRLKEIAGFKDKQCQICGRKNVKRSAIHHVWGSNHPNSPLVVLCPGCHDLINRIFFRQFVPSAAKMEKLINFILAERFKEGAPLAKVIYDEEVVKEDI